MRRSSRTLAKRRSERKSDKNGIRVIFEEAMVRIVQNRKQKKSIYTFKSNKDNMFQTGKIQNSSASKYIITKL